MDAPSAPAPGFELSPVHSAFLRLLGPLWSRTTDDRLELGLLIDDRHHNRRGSAHGGVLATLADVALVRAAATSQDPPLSLSTVSLTIDFAGAVKDGEFVVASVDVQRVGRRLAFANCTLSVGEQRVGHASAVLAAVE